MLNKRIYWEHTKQDSNSKLVIYKHIDKEWFILWLDLVGWTFETLNQLVHSVLTLAFWFEAGVFLMSSRSVLIISPFVGDNITKIRQHWLLLKMEASSSANIYNNVLPYFIYSETCNKRPPKGPHLIWQVVFHHRYKYIKM